MEISQHKYSRRGFVATSLSALTATSLFLFPKTSVAKNNTSQDELSIRQVIEMIQASIPFPQGIPAGTVDTIKYGNPDQPVKGIVTTMFATIAVIRRAIDLKANFIIVHEPTFYN